MEKRKPERKPKHKSLFDKWGMGVIPLQEFEEKTKERDKLNAQTT